MADLREELDDMTRDRDGWSQKARDRWRQLADVTTERDRLAAEVAKLRADLDAARERLAMATRFEFPDGAVYLVLGNADSTVQRWQVSTHPDWKNGERTPMSAHFLGKRFPTADAAFAALDAWRAANGGKDGAK